MTSRYPVFNYHSLYCASKTGQKVNLISNTFKNNYSGVHVRPFNSYIKVTTQKEKRKNKLYTHDYFCL